MSLKYFSLILWVVIIFLMVSLIHNAFNFDEVQFIFAATVVFGILRNTA